MVRRALDWNARLAKSLKNRSFARKFIIAAVEESLPVHVALGRAIRSFGVKEFAAEAGMPASNILRAVRHSSNPTLQTVNRLLAPFGLSLGIKELGRRSRKAA